MGTAVGEVAAVEVEVQEGKQCQECKQADWKYKCPGCERRSCGLACVKAHKARTGCSGKRDRTAFVPLAEFCDNVLVSDYNLLEEMLRQTESAKRARAPLGAPKSKMHPAMQTLQHQAKMRDTTLVYWPHGMSKRKSNSTFFDRKRKCIFWRIEWTFEGTDVRIVNSRVDENSTLRSLVEKHFETRADNVAMITELRHFCRREITDLKLYFQKEPCEGNKKIFYELDVEATVCSQLAHKTVYEFPVIHVALNPDPVKFPVLVTKPLPTATPTPPVYDVEPVFEEEEEEDPVGKFFREEEIEEGEFIP
ncbi:hypothetical protein KC19_3G129500 [Ceratodon purpureus]|uniref:Box C/D snoRNA protein 1 n=1 Tax=Ceratodon purpureus TaxID=3225 RepID=A0A8T0IJ76_CERPU|nr:hypothetical protein KC19_3G129500 [Ceratodon purpureus]